MFNTKQNFYEILNATSNASLEELKSNYKHLILQCHPDKLQQHESADKLENDLNNKEFVAITEAWNCLKDPSRRKQYDAELLLNKFHTHNNIYAHIQLNEMKKCTQTESDFDEFNRVEEMENSSSSNTKDKSSAENLSYIYTYNCRCGGQYIVDESAEQYCRKVNSTLAAAAAAGNHQNTVVGGEGGNGGAEDDDADITQNNNSPNKTAANKNVAVNDGGGGVGGIVVEEGVAFLNKNEEDDDNDVEDDGELIVECSECSLVIILNG